MCDVALTGAVEEGWVLISNSHGWSIVLGCVPNPGRTLLLN